MNKPAIRWMTALLAAPVLLLSACATTEEAPGDFGDSVRHMVDAQIYDRHAAEHPPADPPLGLDGAVAATALKAWREQPTNKQSQPMTMEIPIGIPTSH